MSTPRVTRACERPGCKKTFSCAPWSTRKYCCAACGHAVRHAAEVRQREQERQREKDAYLAAAFDAPDPLADVWKDRQFNPFGGAA